MAERPSRASWAIGFELPRAPAARPAGPGALLVNRVPLLTAGLLGHPDFARARVDARSSPAQRPARDGASTERPRPRTLHRASIAYGSRTGCAIIMVPRQGIKRHILRALRGAALVARSVTCRFRSFCDKERGRGVRGRAPGPAHAVRRSWDDGRPLSLSREPVLGERGRPPSHNGACHAFARLLWRAVWSRDQAV